MASFALICVDKPAHLAARMAAREAHLAYVGRHRAMVRLAGPLLGDDGEMAGSLFILDVAGIEDARTFNAADPYTLAGLFERVEVLPMRVTIGPTS